MSKDANLRYDPENEIKAIAASMIDPKEAAFELIDKLQPSDFHDTRNANIFEAIRDLIEKGEEPGFSQVFDYLRHNGNLEKAGGLNYLQHDVLEHIATSAGVGYHIDQIQKAAKYVETQIVIESLNRKALSGKGEAGELIGEMAEKAAALAENTQTTGPQLFSENYDEVAEHLLRLSGGSRMPVGLETGFPTLDYKLSGFQPGQLIILGARPGVGKTALATQWACHAAMQGQAVLYFTLEMSGREMRTRIISSLGRLNLKEPFKISDAHKIANQYKDLPLYIDATASLMPHQIEARAKQIINKTNNLGLIVVDYLQLVQCRERKSIREQEVAVVSRALKRLAMQTKIPVVALSQLSRLHKGIAPRPPILSDLRESGSLEQDADIVIFIDRKMEESATDADLIIAKNRNGAIGKDVVTFVPEYTLFECDTGLTIIPGGYDEPF